MSTFTTRPELLGTFGMVSATHYLASAAAMAVLESGGNAIDAAVAAGFTLQVVEPHLNGPGGDMSLIFALPGADPVVLCGQGSAPAAATPAAVRQRGLDRVPGSGVVAAAIPGSTVAWLTLLRDHGTRSLANVLACAIYYAEQGYPVVPGISQTIGRVADILRVHWPASAALYLPDGAPPAAGTLARNPVLADTYRRLVTEATNAGGGREAGIDAAIRAWTGGFVAEAIDAFCSAEQTDGDGRRYAGLLRGEDLGRWRPVYETPVSAPFAGWQLYKTGPWGQGPVLLQALRILDGLPVVPDTAEAVHTVIEAAKLAFADREAYYGDSLDVPIDELLSAEYAVGRRALITGTASRELRPGRPGGRMPRIPNVSPAVASDPAAGEPTVSRTGETRGDTCHVDVIDRWGGMVSATPSGGWLQSSPVIGDLGFPLGTRLQMTTLEPGFATTLIPGRRPRTTLSPTVAVHQDGHRLAFGTPGGDQQDQWQLVFALHHLLGGADLQAAIDAPCFHSTHFPSSFHPHEAHPGQIVVEDRIGAAVIDGLRDRGHDVVVSGPWSLGRMCAVGTRAGSGVLRAAANPRGMQGYAVGR